jgi:hypothetical protein
MLWTHSGSICLSAKMIAHMIGWPFPQVNPSTEKCASFVLAHCCALSLPMQRNFSPPMFPSFS